MSENELVKENFEAFISKIRTLFYRIDFHVKFANSFGFLPGELRSLQILKERFGYLVGDYFDFYFLMNRFVACGIIEKIRPVKNIGFHKGINWNKYREIVNETNVFWQEKKKQYAEETSDELRKKDLVKCEDEILPYPKG